MSLNHADHAALMGSILMNMRELADYLRYPPPVSGKRYRGQDKALAFLKRRGIPLEHRGKVVLVRKVLVDAALRDEPMPPPKKRHRQLLQGGIDGR